jgi:hypothetical protein
MQRFDARRFVKQGTESIKTAGLIIPLKWYSLMTMVKKVQFSG